MQIKFPSQQAEKEPSIRERLIQWKQPIIMTISGIILAISAFSYLAKRKESTSQEFFIIHSILSDLKDGKALDIVPVQNMLGAHPECSPNFDQFLLQKHFLSGDATTTEKILHRVNSRVSSFLNPYFLKFSEASLMMQEQKYDEALGISKAILSDMEAEKADEEYPQLTRWLKQRVRAIEKQQI